MSVFCMILACMPVEISYYFMPLIAPQDIILSYMPQSHLHYILPAELFCMYYYKEWNNLPHYDHMMLTKVLLQLYHTIYFRLVVHYIKLSYVDLTSQNP